MSISRRAWEALPRKRLRESLFGGMSALAQRISKPEPSGTESLTVAGYFSATTGLGEGARRMFDATRTQGLIYSLGYAAHSVVSTEAGEQMHRD